jgi:hypothetical protein
VHLDIDFEDFAVCLENSSQGIRYNKIEGEIQGGNVTGKKRAETEVNQEENGRGWLMMGRDVEGKTDGVFQFEEAYEGSGGDVCTLNRVYL